MASLFLYSGVFLIYFPSLLLWGWQRILQRRFEQSIIPISVVISVALTGFMVINSVASPLIFLFYLGLFWSLFFAGKKLSRLSNVVSVSMSLYACYAVSELYEWPIQVTIPQNPVAVALSGFQLLGLIFFFKQASKLGWKPTREFYKAIASCLLIGVGVALNIWILGIDKVFWFAHSYRLVWVMLFLGVYIELRAKKFLGKDLPLF